MNFRIGLSIVVFLLNVIIYLIYQDASPFPYLISGNVIVLMSAVGLKGVFLKILNNGPYRVFALLALLVTFYAVVMPLTRHSGWPENHEGLYWKFRMINYYLHFLDLDFLPLWSSGDCFGLGAPAPLFYHKLFYYVSAMLYMFIGHVKATIILSICLFMFVGVGGIYRSLLLLGVNVRHAMLLSLLFPLMNYTATEWLVRGNMAEFSALCILPWLLEWAIALLRSEQFSFRLIPLFILLFLAHNIIAFYSLFCLMIVLLVYIRSHQRTLNRLLVRNFMISGIAIMSVLSIFLLPMMLVSDDYNLEKIKVGMEVQNKFQNFWNYLFDTSYHWAVSQDYFSVEFSYFFTIIFVYFLMNLLYRSYLKGPGWKNIWNDILTFLKEDSHLFLISSLGIFMFLQLPISGIVYKMIPGADYIQFPWRLLTFIQTILILVLGILMTRSIRHWPFTGNLIYTLFAGMILSYPFLKNLKSETWKWKEEGELEMIENRGVWGTGGEYIPVVEGIKANDYHFYYQLSVEDLNSHFKGKLGQTEMLNSESVSRSYEVSCEEPSEIVLNVNYSGLERIFLIQGIKRKEITAYRSSGDPRIRIKLPKGQHLLMLKLPCTSNVLVKLGKAILS